MTDEELNKYIPNYLKTKIKENNIKFFVTNADTYMNAQALHSIQFSLHHFGTKLLIFLLSEALEPPSNVPSACEIKSDTFKRIP